MEPSLEVHPHTDSRHDVGQDDGLGNGSRCRRRPTLPLHGKRQTDAGAADTYGHPCLGTIVVSEGAPQHPKGLRKDLGRTNSSGVSGPLPVRPRNKRQRAPLRYVGTARAPARITSPPEPVARPPVHVLTRRNASGR
jgi:hypothetical protein